MTSVVTGDLAAKRGECVRIQARLDERKELALLEANVALKVLAQVVHCLDGLGPILKGAESDPQIEMLAQHPHGKFPVVAGISGDPTRKQGALFERKVIESQAVPEGEGFRASRLDFGCAAEKHRCIKRLVMVVRERMELFGALHLTSTAPAGNPLGE